MLEHTTTWSVVVKQGGRSGNDGAGGGRGDADLPEKQRERRAAEGVKLAEKLAKDQNF